MGNVAIVAIPEKEDYVWKLSSEKIPHMTLLNLGDALSDDDIAHVMEYIDHAANMSLTRFYMSVERRGPLGPNEADVLFFDKGSCGPEMAAAIDRFRSYLLREDKIKTAYDVAPQYEDWTPHLTLGYPESPAKPDLREYSGIHGMTFDKIALWVDDYAGPEFELASHASALAMSATDDESLEQSGVKGMRWGIRKDYPELTTGEGQQILKTATNNIHKDLGGINEKYRNVDFKTDKVKSAEYSNAVATSVQTRINESVKTVLGDKKTAHFQVLVGVEDTGQIVLTIPGKTTAKHEAKVDRFVFDLVKDEDGFVIEVVPSMDLAHSSEAIAHVGVKGMKWGVRRSREQRKAAREEQVQRHQDSVRTRELMKKKVSSLSNEELAFVNQRRQLETTYAKLNPPKAGRRKKKIENHLATLGLIEKTFTATQQPVAQLALKKALKSANTPRAQKILKALIKP